MKKQSNKTSAIIASAAAAMLSSAPTIVSADSSDSLLVGECWGVNACKGSSACKTASSSCAGQNACKSQGFIRMTELQCSEFGGDFMKIGEQKQWVKPESDG